MPLFAHRLYTEGGYSGQQRRIHLCTAADDTTATTIPPKTTTTTTIRIPQKHGHNYDLDHLWTCLVSPRQTKDSMEDNRSLSDWTCRMQRHGNDTCLQRTVTTTTAAYSHPTMIPGSAVQRNDGDVYDVYVRPACGTLKTTSTCCV